MIEDIRYLIVFARIAQAGPVSAGAQALGIATATASEHLARLEKSLGTALLYRNTRKLSLTGDGARLLETAGAMLELYEKGVIEFRARAVSSGGRLHVSMPAVFINSAFTAHLAAFVRRHPALELRITCSDSREDIVAEGIDLALRIGEMPDSSLKARHLFLLPRRVVAAPSLLAGHPPLEHPADLAGLPWLGLSMRPDVRVFRHAGRGEAVEVGYAPQVRVDNVEAAWRLTVEGIGLSAPPDYLSAEALRRGEIVQVLPEWTLDPLQVHAVWPSNVSTSSAAYALVNALYDAFNPAPG